MVLASFGQKFRLARLIGGEVERRRADLVCAVKKSERNWMFRSL
jgi:hypothetical protein